MKLMVYGTLKSGWGNNRLLEGATFIGNAVTHKGYVLVNTGFPMALTTEVEGKKALPVFGEVWEITAAHLERCDRLEGHPNWYIRREVDVTYQATGTDDRVMIYEMPENPNRSLRLCPVVDDKYYIWDGYN